MQRVRSIYATLQHSRHYVWIRLMLMLGTLGLFILAAGAPFSGGGPVG